MSALEEREAGANNQWREATNGGRPIGWGCGGSNASPTWRKPACGLTIAFKEELVPPSY